MNLHLVLAVLVQKHISIALCKMSLFEIMILYEEEEEEAAEIACISRIYYFSH